MPLSARQYPQVQQRRAGQASRVNVASPTGGLNTRDSESEMEPRDATMMTNWFPGQGKVTTRKGYSVYASGLTGDVETLAEYNAGTNRKLLCANSDEINDVTNPLSITNLGSGFSNARWQWANFNASMLLVNGSDTPQEYNGSTLTNSTLTLTAGPASSTMTGINVHKNRVYLWDDDTQDFWYGATNAIAGSFTKFPLSRVAPFGGNLVAMATWNHDGGDGVDDFALFLMSSGEAILYAGSDPGADFNLVGIYRIGAPFAIRGLKKIAGDVFIITDQDFTPFSQVFQAGGAVTSQTKLSGAAVDAVERFRDNYGWEVALYPKASTGGWLIFNVPVATNVTYIQYIVNTVTGAATKFTGMNARTWGLFNNNMYFGESGKIMLADNTLADDGNFIECDVQQAFNELGSPAEKTVNSFRNVIKVDGNVTLNTTVSFDYGQSSVTQTVSSSSVGTPWGSPWGSPWSPVSQIRNNLVISSGEGVALGMRIQTSLSGQQLEWFRTDYSVNVSNII